MRRIARRLRGPSLAVVAMLPGFAFPFTVSALLGQARSDPFFLAISIALVLSNVLGNTIEIHSAVQMGRIRASGGTVYRTQLKRYRRLIRSYTLVSVLVVGPILIALYWLNIASEDRVEYFAVAVLTLLVPIIGGEASTRSGQLIADGRHELAISVQSLRTLVPLVVVIVFPALTLFLLAVAMVFGELSRLAILSKAVSKPSVRSEGSGHDLKFHGLPTQSISTAAMQAAPVADRLFLSWAPPGSITSYELADKFFFAGAQFLNLSLLVGKMRSWTGLRQLERAKGLKLLKRDFSYLVGLSSVASVLGIAFLSAVPAWLAIPREWIEGFGWAQILLLSLPATVVSMACSRLLIVADRQKILLWFASAVTVLTVLADGLFFSLFGAVGIPVAAVAVRGITALVYVVLVWHCLKTVIGASYPTDAETTESVAGAQSR